MTFSTDEVINLSSVRQTDAHESVSNRYEFINTGRVLEELTRDYGLIPLSATQTRVRDERKEGFQKHAIVMHNPQWDKAYSVDGTTPRLTLVNSHSKTASFRLYAGLYRSICANGLFVGNTHSELRIRHSGFSLEQLEKGIQDYILSIPRVFENIEKMQNAQLSIDGMKQFGTDALALRLDRDDKTLPFYFDNPALRYRREQDKGFDVWRTYQRTQESIMKGSLWYRDGTKKTKKLRKLTAIDKTIKFNQNLWNLAESYCH